MLDLTTKGVITTIFEPHPVTLHSRSSFAAAHCMLAPTHPRLAVSQNPAVGAFSELDVADTLVSFMTAFYKAHPELDKVKNKFFLSGESYAVRGMRVTCTETPSVMDYLAQGCWRHGPVAEAHYLLYLGTAWVALVHADFCNTTACTHLPRRGTTCRRWRQSLPWQPTSWAARLCRASGCGGWPWATHASTDCSP